MFKPRKAKMPDGLQYVLDNVGDVDWAGRTNAEVLQTIEESLGDLNDETRNYIENADLAQTLQENWNGTVNQGSNFMQKYGAAIKSTIASAGVMLVVSLALSTAFKLISDYIHRFENAKNAFEDSVSKFEESKQKTEELTEELEECRDRISL